LRTGRLFRGVVLALAWLSVAAWPALGRTFEEVLYWDDGSGEFYYPPTTPAAGPGVMAAVRFQAPGWARSLVGIRVYIMNDNEPNPSTRPFVVWAWRATEGLNPDLPAADAYMPFDETGQYGEETWVEIRFPSAIDITDPEYFPDRWFFVGIEWLYRRNPLLGLDADPPTYGHSLAWNLSEWEAFESDLLLRAIVSSEGSPIDPSSWTYIKTLFQD
jgi:hypothetical protein